MQTYSRFTSSIEKVTFSSDSSLVFAASYAGSIVVWDVAYQKVRTTLKEHLAKCQALCAADMAGSSLLASGGVDQKVKLWDLRQKGSVHTLKSHTMPIKDVKIQCQ